MAKLYPPYIEGTLPAFCLNSEGDGTIIIPFAHNKAVSKADIGNLMYVKVKTVQNDVLMGSGSAEWTGEVSIDQVVGDGQIELNVKGNSTLNNVWKPQIGQYYKVQIAYGDINYVVGYYSTVGVIKCTSKPKVSILGMTEGKVNNNNNVFVGQFEQEAGGDVTEKVFSSKFTITDLKGNEIATSGDILHNVENNPNSYTSIDEMKFNRDLEFGEVYKIRYDVITNNELHISSPSYLLMQQKSLEMQLKGTLKADLNYEDGYIDINLIGYVDDEGVEEIGNGAFVLSREDSLNPGYWNELGRFSLKYESPTKTLFRDFTIEQGKTYTYCIQQYNANQVYSNRKKSNTIYADFEDMFLFDGERQLKLRFNPQVSSFKTQLAETRAETIGSKYPFFFRNARVGYKVFPISGLISMLIDDNEFFVTYEEILRDHFSGERHKTIGDSSKKKESSFYNHDNGKEPQIIPESEEDNTKKLEKWEPPTYDHKWEINRNYTSERLFKLKVLDWFNNGKVKLFKSPGEGNYLVRLMDTSLAPQDTLGRMIHTINSTAYECADCVYSKMVEYGIIEDSASTTTIEDTYTTNWYEKSIITAYEESNGNFFPNRVNSDSDEYYSNNLLESDLENGQAFTTILKFTDLMPGTKIRLVYSKGGDFNSNNHDDIVIGATGNYFADDVEPVYGIYMIQKASSNQLENNIMGASLLRNDNANKSITPISLEGNISYQYSVPIRNSFNSIESIQTDIGAHAQFVGQIDDIVQKLESTRDQISRIPFIRFFKRPIGYLFYRDSFYDSNNNLNLYWDIDKTATEKYSFEENMQRSPFCLYILHNSMINEQDATEHLKGEIEKILDGDGEERAIHIKHMFERYYIDRYLKAQTAEDKLIEYLMLLNRIETIEDNEEKDILNNYFSKNPLYIIDPWNNSDTVFEVKLKNDGFVYNPTIKYNNNEVDLREIQRYELENLDPQENPENIKVGNGVYGDIFYNKVITNYIFEKIEKDLKNKKDYYNNINESLYNQLYNSTSGYHEPTLEDLEELDNAYYEYNKELKRIIKKWITPESEWSEEDE